MPSLSKNKLSFFLLPKIVFQRQSNIETVYNIYLVEVLTLGSFKHAIIKSIPPFLRNNFLLGLQSLQRLDIIENDNSLISIGLSLSCYSKSIKLSNIPSSVIFNL